MNVAAYFMLNFEDFKIPVKNVNKNRTREDAENVHFC